jgi:hypothetical protein
MCKILDIRFALLIGPAAGNEQLARQNMAEKYKNYSYAIIIYFF